jgi:hypothetical protein
MPGEAGMEERADELCRTILWRNLAASSDSQQTPRMDNQKSALLRTQPRRAAMNKVGKPFFLCFPEQICPNAALSKTYSDSSLYLKDKRVAQLLLLLQLLHRDVGGLAELPRPELSEIISSAVGVCGFINPIEAQDVIAVVLNAIETEDRIAIRIQESP